MELGRANHDPRQKIIATAAAALSLSLAFGLQPPDSASAAPAETLSASATIPGSQQVSESQRLAWIATAVTMEGMGPTYANHGVVLEELIKAGLTPLQAAGLDGGFVVESGKKNLYPDAVGDGGTSYGIGQWHQGRHDNLNNFAATNHLNPSQIRTQAKFVVEELTHSESAAGRMFTAADTIQAVVNADINGYERPKDRTGNIAPRTRETVRVLGLFNGVKGVRLPESGVNGQTIRLVYKGGKTYIAPQDLPSAIGGVPYFAQSDPRWANQSYGSSNLAYSGCGPTAVLNALESVNPDLVNGITPVDVAKYIVSVGGRATGGTTEKGLIDAVINFGGNAQAYNIAKMSVATVKGIIKSNIDNGSAIIMSGRSTSYDASPDASPATVGGHILTINGLSPNGYAYIQDSQNPNKSLVPHDEAELIKADSLGYMIVVSNPANSGGKKHGNLFAASSSGTNQPSNTNQPNTTTLNSLYSESAAAANNDITFVYTGGGTPYQIPAPDILINPVESLVNDIPVTSSAPSASETTNTSPKPTSSPSAAESVPSATATVSGSEMASTNPSETAASSGATASASETASATGTTSPTDTASATGTTSPTDTTNASQTPTDYSRDFVPQSASNTPIVEPNLPEPTDVLSPSASATTDNNSSGIDPNDPAEYNPDQIIPSTSASASPQPSPNASATAQSSETIPSASEIDPSYNGPISSKGYGVPLNPAVYKLTQITCFYNGYHSIPGFHTGVDFAAPIGTPVDSVRPGTVVLVVDNAKYGIIVIKQNDGKFVNYQHLSQIMVTKGEQVKLGERIGLTGDRGAPGQRHLHVTDANIPPINGTVPSKNEPVKRLEEETDNPLDYILTPAQAKANPHMNNPLYQ